MIVIYCLGFLLSYVERTCSESELVCFLSELRKETENVLSLSSPKHSSLRIKEVLGTGTYNSSLLTQFDFCYNGLFAVHNKTCVVDMPEAHHTSLI